MAGQGLIKEVSGNLNGSVGKGKGCQQLEDSDVQIIIKFFKTLFQYNTPKIFMIYWLVDLMIFM